MKTIIKSIFAKQLYLILIVFFINISSTVFGQSVTNVTPNIAAQGTLGLQVSFTIESVQNPLPPIDAPVNEVTIGTIKGTSLVHVSETEITGIFNIPFDEEIGLKDVAVTFQPPQGIQLIFSMPDGFTVTEMEDSAPVITTQPKSQAIIIGKSASLSIVANGTNPLSYQWQKEKEDIDGATNDIFTINSFSQDDVGTYRCIVSNDLGSTTSDDADLSENTSTYEGTFPIVDTKQLIFYNNQTEIEAPAEGQSFYGQDAQYSGHQPSYIDNGDGTITDNVTGLMWQQSFDHNGDSSIDINDKLSYDEILAMLNEGVTFAGYDDWRLPNIKEQYSLIMFSGKDISGYDGNNTDSLIPFINKDVFEYAYGDTDAGERLIDVQCASTSVYVATDVEELVFGVNFADGRIKGYGKTLFGQDKQFNYLLVRGNKDYGINNFVDNGDRTISDKATGLMWMQDDNGEAILWENALSYAEGFEFAGYSDWRLPNAKELQSIVDYSRSPSTTNSAAIDPLFNCTGITNEAGEDDFPWYWSGTTHANWTEGNEGAWGAYVCFGRALGNMNGWRDVHGAGAQRSDPKTGDPAEYSEGHGPQGDAVRIYNYTRLVRDDKPATGSSLGIESVTPNSAKQGTSGLLVKFVISGDQLPPAQAPVESATIGTIKGTSLVHVSETEITGIFNIPFDEEIGLKDVAVTFQPPQGNPLVFSMEDGFTVTELEETAPIITKQPKSKAIKIGKSTSLSILAYGTIPLTYQWQKNEVDIDGASSDVFVIAAFTQDDIGSYRCIVSNSLGTATSETADLTENTTSYEDSYLIVDTGQDTCYDANGDKIDCPAENEDFYGQDAQFKGAQFSFESDGQIVTDLNTGLMWQRIPTSEDFSWKDAVDYCESLELDGYDDWRIPSLKELFSISNFNSGWPYIDLNYFSLASGQITKDEQYWSSNYYVGTTAEGGENSAFGVNHVTGHIKAYPANATGPVGGKYVRAVRGDTYGENDFKDNGDGTITDKATGLMWSKDDEGVTLDWENALAYAENSELAGYTDWRLPDVKELQSIVDYSYSPSASVAENVGPAIDKIFNCTPITNEAGDDDYGYYWTNTSASFRSGEPHYYAWYVAFGRAVNGDGVDFHGAGGVRFDTKVEGGPLGEGGERFYNFVRLVRNVDGNGTSNNEIGTLPEGFKLTQNYPNPFDQSTTICFTLPTVSMVSLKIYNNLGQQVASLVNGQLEAGEHEYQWNVENMPNGVYYYEVSTDSYSQTKIMLVAK